MAVDISIGTQLSVVKGAPATNDQSGFEALTYTDVAQVESLSEFGGTREVPTFTPLDTGVVAKFAGSKNYGSTTIPIAYNSNSGQIILEEGFDGSGDGSIHSFKIANDAAGVIYFQGYITGFAYNIGDANTVTMANVTVELTDAVVKVPSA